MRFITEVGSRHCCGLGVGQRLKTFDSRTGDSIHDADMVVAEVSRRQMENWIRMLRIHTEKTNSNILWYKCSVDFKFRTPRPAHPQYVPGIKNAAVLFRHEESEADR